jgi:fructose-bisphosphate aldolase class II
MFARSILIQFRVASWRTLALTAFCLQNVTSSSTAVAALEAARDKKSPIILQMSQGGGAYFAGKVRNLYSSEP